MKKQYVVVLFVVLAFVGVLSVTSFAEEQKSLTLKVADFSPPKTARTEVFKWWGDEIEKRTEGKIKFQFYWSQGLVKARQIPNAIRSGLADVGAWLTPYYSTKFPLSCAFLLPFLGNAMTVSHEVARDLIVSRKELVAEFDNWNAKLLYVVPLSSPTEFFVKPVNSLADFKGLKFRGLGYSEIVFRHLGASTVTIPMPEMYEALQRGTVEGEYTSIHAWHGYGHWEVAKYVLKDNLGYAPSLFHVVNKDVWNKLSPQYQSIIDQVSQVAFYKTAALMYDEQITIFDKLSDKGVKVLSLDRGEYAKWARIAGPLAWEKWIKDTESKGLPARELLESYKEELRKRGALIGE